MLPAENHLRQKKPSRHDRRAEGEVPSRACSFHPSLWVWRVKPQQQSARGIVFLSRHRTLFPTGLAVTALVMALMVIAAAPASAQATLTVFMGSSAHAPLAVVFDLEGYDSNGQSLDDVYINKPQWETKPFYEAPYYSIRVGHGRWDVELIHDKMYLMNPVPPIEHFEVSHGYNLLLLNRAYGDGPITWRTGLGIVVAHPESTVAGQKLGYGYELMNGFHISGPAGQVSVAYTHDLRGPFFLTVEAKGTVAWAKVPVYNGWATVPHAAAHLLAGIGVQLW